VPDYLAHYTAQRFGLDEARASMIVKLFRDQEWQQTPLQMSGQGQGPAPEGPEQESPPAREVSAWVKALSIWNYLTDPVWIFFFSTGASGYMGLRGLGAASAGLPLRAALPTLRPAINLGGVPSRQLMAATKNPYYSEELANWYAAGHKGKMPMITPAEQRAFNIASSPVGQNAMQRGTKIGLPVEQATTIPETELLAMERTAEQAAKAELEAAQAAGRSAGNYLQRITRLNLPQRAATQLTETEILAAELNTAYRQQLQAYYAASGTSQPIAKPTMTSERLLEIVSRNASRASAEPAGVAGLGTDPYGTGNPPWGRAAQGIYNWANRAPAVGKLGSGVGGTGFTAEQLAAMGTRATGYGEMTANPAFSKMGMGRTVPVLSKAGLQSMAGEAAVGLLPIIAYEIPMSAYTLMSGQPWQPIPFGPTIQTKQSSRIASIRERARAQGIPEGMQEQYTLDPLSHIVGGGIEGWTSAYDPEAGFLRNVGNVIGGGAYGIAKAPVTYFTQRVKQYTPEVWDPTKVSSFGSAWQKSPTYTPGGLLAYNLGYTPQESGLSPGAWLLQQKKGGSGGIRGG